MVIDVTELSLVDTHISCQRFNGANNYLDRIPVGGIRHDWHPRGPSTQPHDLRRSASVRMTGVGSTVAIGGIRE